MFVRTSHYNSFRRVAKLFDKCSFDEQCSSNAGHSECQPNLASGVKLCACMKGYRFSGGQCLVDYSNDSKRALEIYKITMIFASSCLAIILLIFLACILKKSYCPSDGEHILPLDNSVPDIFTLFPDAGAGHADMPFGVRPPFDKPPTYDESQRAIRAELGSPPPAYCDSEISANNNNDTRIVVPPQGAMAACFIPNHTSSSLPIQTNADLQTTSLASSSSTSSQGDEQQLVPSTSSGSRLGGAQRTRSLGVDNRAFSSQE